MFEMAENMAEHKDIDGDAAAEQEEKNLNRFGGIWVDPNDITKEWGTVTGYRYAQGTQLKWFRIIVELLKGSTAQKAYRAGNPDSKANNHSQITFIGRMLANKDFQAMYDKLKEEETEALRRRFQWSREYGARVLMKGLSVLEQRIDQVAEMAHPERNTKKIMAELSQAKSLIQELNNMFGITRQGVDLGGAVVFISGEDKLQD